MVMMPAHARCDAELEPANTHQRVREEILSLLAQVPTVDLGTLYGTIVELLPEVSNLTLATVIFELVREGRIAIQTNAVFQGPVIGVVSRTDGCSPSTR